MAVSLHVAVYRTRRCGDSLRQHSGHQAYRRLESALAVLHSGSYGCVRHDDLEDGEGLTSQNIERLFFLKIDVVCYNIVMQTRLIAHALIFNDDGQILIIQRAKNNDVLPLVWDIPGGSCEPGEDPLKAAIRETMEEAGIVVDDLRLLAHTSNVDTAKNTQFVRFIFAARYRRGEISLNLREHEAFAWVDPKLPTQQPLVDYLPDVLKFWLEGKAARG